MRTLFFLILSVTFTLNVVGQVSDMIYLDSVVHRGFTNKAEAENKTVNGLREGKWLEYFGVDNRAAVSTDQKHATAYTLSIYKAGKTIGSTQFYMDGKIMAERVYRRSKRDTVLRFYYESGKVCTDYPLPKAHTKGTEDTYYENGKLKSETIYSADRQEVIIKNYDENGNEIK